MTLPSVAVVTPTHGRVDLVIELLDSLISARQRYRDAGGVSHVVIVDSSDDEDARRIREACAGRDALFVAGPTSVRAKRNIGVRTTDADLIVFTDSDCRVNDDFLTGHGLLARDAAEHVAGFVGLTEFYGEETWAWRAAAASPFLDSFSFAQRYPQVEWAPFTNMSVRRSVYDEIGGFIEDWDFRLGADDVEFGRRITRDGRVLVSAPTSLVWHSRSTWSRWENVLERAKRWGWMDVPLRQAQPREHLHVWLRGVPGALVLAVPGLVVALAGRRPLAATGALLAGAAIGLLVDSLERPARQPDAALGALLRAVFEGAAWVHGLVDGDPLLGISEIAPDPRARRQDVRGRSIRTAAAVAGGVAAAAVAAVALTRSRTNGWRPRP